MRVIGIRNYGMTVPDLKEGIDYITTFGLEMTDQGDRVVGRCVGRDMDQVILVKGKEKRYRHTSFAVEPGSLPDWETRLKEKGVELVEGEGPGLWFHDPEQRLVNLMDEPLAPWRPAEEKESQYNLGDSVDRVDVALWHTATEPALPRRLSHVLCFSADVKGCEQFYTDVLGLRVSDRLVGHVLASFMNSGPGDHHIMALIESTHPGLHHSSWEVPNADQIVAGSTKMAEAGYELHWGLGRHTVGSNMFTYILDPWGSWAEYTCDMDQVTDDWVSQDQAAPPHIWAATPPPPEFVQNHEPKTEAKKSGGSFWKRALGGAA